MHDLGKIGIPDKILTEPGKLDPVEQDIMMSISVC
jgi:HD-GYP domain-containing protein (c-di-GMP phosphodiesterase class II)